MSVVPTNKAQRVAFFRGHIQQWTDNASAIGVVVADVNALNTLVTTAETNLAAQTLAQQAARDAVATCDQSVELMTLKGMELIKQIRAKATTAGAGVYPLAGLPVPPVPSPNPPPGQATDFAAKLLPNGSLELTWKCENPGNAAGPVYHVYRRQSATEEWTFIGGAGEKKFPDNTVPAGVPRLYYQVQAARSTSVGVAAEFVVNFGVNSAGAMTATVTSEQQSPKLAA